MEPISTTTLAMKTSEVASKVETCLPSSKELEAGLRESTDGGPILLSKAEVKELAPIPLMGGSQFQVGAFVENIPIAERHASFFSATEFKELKITELPEVQGFQIRLGDRELNVSLKDGDLLASMGIKNAISYAMNPALEQFTEIRLNQLRHSDAPVAERLVQTEVMLPTPNTFAIRVSDAGGFFQKLEDRATEIKDQFSGVFVAKRIDYLVGSQYVPGKVCDLPLVGGVSNVVFKKKLGFEVEGQDWGKLGEDVFMIVSVAAIPLAPAAGGLAMLGWIGANAAFGAVTQGTISHLNGSDGDQALKDAGKGALLGAVGGVAGVAVAGKIMPAISNKLLASAASGATVGGSTSATSATIRVIEKGEDFTSAAKEIVKATVVGSAGGAVLGASSFGISKIVSKLQSEVWASSSLRLSPAAKEFERFRGSIEPSFPTDRPLHGGDIRNFSKKLDTQLSGFVAHLKETDASFSNRVDKLGAKLSEAVAAKDPALIAKLERQMARDLSGYLAEAKVKAIFEPFFEKITVQKRVRGGATIIDMVAEGAKHPIALKGHRFIERGGSLPIEVKAGTERYFQSEIKSGHLLKQLAGHEEFGKGLVVTTRDVGDALMKTGRAREILKEAGSSPYRLLPPKSDLDRAIEHLLKGELGEAMNDWAKWSSRSPLDDILRPDTRVY